MKVMYVKRDYDPLYLQLRKLKYAFPYVRYIHADENSLAIYCGEWSRKDDEEIPDEMEEQ